MANTDPVPLIDLFVSYLSDDFGSYCEQNGMEKSSITLLHFLMEIALVSKKDIQVYVLRKSMDELARNEMAANKTHIVRLLAHRFKVSERTVWSLLKKA